jgi:hypothetical protein
MLMEGERGRAMAVEDRAAAALLRHVNWLAVAVALGRTLVVAPSFNSTRYSVCKSIPLHLPSSIRPSVRPSVRPSLPASSA